MEPKAIDLNEIGVKTQGGHVNENCINVHSFTFFFFSFFLNLLHYISEQRYKPILRVHNYTQTKKL